MKRATLGLSALLAVLLLVAAPVAQAHSDLVESTPADGAALDALPAEVSLLFSEELLPETVKVSVADGDGNVVLIAAPAVDGAKVLFPWPGWPGTPSTDQWSVNYRVVSQDGHPVSGTLSFTAPPAVVTPAAGVTPSPASAIASPAAAPSAAAATAAPAPAAPSAPAATEEPAPSGTSVAPILMIVAGLAAGIGIGLAFAARRRRTPSA